MKYSLLPQFYCSYSFNDLIYSVLNLFKSNYNIDNLSNYLECNNIYFTNYARTSLRIFLSSLNLKKGANIGVQAYTCHTVFQAIQNAGYSPFFIDVNDDYTIDLKDLIKKSQKFEVLIITHTFGIPAVLDEIKKHIGNKIIIEDCAHSLFSLYNNQPVGTFGDASIFSFGYGKYPSIGPGGFICINNSVFIENFNKEFNKLSPPSLILEIKNIIKNFIWALSFKKTIYALFTYPIGKKLDDRFNFTGKSTFHEKKGYKSNVNLFLKKFEKYRIINKKQIDNGNFLSLKLSKFVKIRKDNNNQKSNCFIFPLRSINREDIVKVLYENGIESGKYFSKSIEWTLEYGYSIGDCPNCERIVKEIYTIPSYFKMTTKELNQIVSLFEQNRKLFDSKIS